MSGGDDDPNQYIDLDKKQQRLVDNTSELKVELEDGSLDKREMAVSIGYSIRTLNFESFKLLLDYFDFEPDGLYSVSRIITHYVLDAVIKSAKSSSYDVSESDLEKFIDYVGEENYISEISDEKYDRFLVTTFFTPYSRKTNSRVEKVKNIIDLIESYRIKEHDLLNYLQENNALLKLLSHAASM